MRRVHFEPWLVKGAPPPAAAWGAIEPEAALAGLAESVGSLATFVGADRITLGRVVPARLRAPLDRALRAKPPAPPRKASRPDATGPAVTDTDVAEPDGVDDQVPV